MSYLRKTTFFLSSGLNVCLQLKNCFSSPRDEEMLKTPDVHRGHRHSKNEGANFERLFEISSWLKSEEKDYSSCHSEGNSNSIWLIHVFIVNLKLVF